MDPVIKQDRDRLRSFKKYGYDIPKARSYVIAKAGLNKCGSMLEVGTGRGHMAVALAQKGFKLISIDLDRKASEAAKIHLKAIKRGKSVILKIMDAERLRYDDNHFDQVISVNFIHHARDPIKCIKEMIRVTRKRLVIADINKRGERIMEKVHRSDGHSHAPSKISQEGTEALLKNAGMKVVVHRDICQTVLVATKGVSR
ncbi:MAG: class I SAM-dependent methyltransferase [Candidatus Omnitrophota bacterium]